jgi:hypothetical protein
MIVIAYNNIIDKRKTPHKIKESKTMTKTTKNINARYNMDNGIWTIRDNGEVIAEGNGVETYAKAIVEIKKTATKKVVEKWVEM